MAHINEGRPIAILRPLDGQRLRKTYLYCNKPFDKIHINV